MNNRLAKQAGSALVWKAAQLAGTKGIFLVRTLILARLLSPEDFGLLAIATIAIGLLLGITDFGLVPALVQRSQADEHHYNAAWTLGLLRALAITGVVIAAAPFIATLFAEPRATEIIRVLALQPLLQAIASIKVADLTRNLQFRSLAFISLPEALVNTVISITLASMFGVWALVAGALTGSAAYVVMSYLLAPHRPRLALDHAAARPLIRYGRWILVTSMVVMAGSFMLQVVISRRLGTVELGLYFLATKLAFLPYEVSSEVIGSVAFPLYARLKSDMQQAVQAFQTIIRGMAAMLFPIYLLIIVLAPSLVENVLGPRWAGTVPVIQVLALVGLASLLVDATIPLLKGLGQPHKVALLEGIQALLLVVLAWTLAGRYGVVGAALAWLPAIGVSLIICAIFAQHILDRPFTGLRGPMMAIIAATGAGAAVAFSIDSMFSSFGGLVAAASLAMTVTGGLLWALDRYFDLGIADNLSRAFPQIARLVDLWSNVWVSKSKSHSA